jgi:hypothetical protein
MIGTSSAPRTFSTVAGGEKTRAIERMVQAIGVEGLLPAA